MPPYPTPFILGESTTTVIRSLGRWAGKNPVNDATCWRVLYAPFIIFCDVPVFPATLNPFNCALRAVPSLLTTSESISPMREAIFAEPRA